MLVFNPKKILTPTEINTENWLQVEEEKKGEVEIIILEDKDKDEDEDNQTP